METVQGPFHSSEYKIIPWIDADCGERCQDEFYGGYYYGSNCDGSVVSAADNIVDVDRDDVLIIDGLTKRFRLPGWVEPQKIPL